MQKELRRVVDGVTDRARRGDVLVMAAALTTYAAFGLVPLLAISARLTSALLGPDRVVRTARGLAGFVPGPLHLDTSIVSFAQHAATAPWWTVLVALLPASLYAEGIVRCLERFSTTPERRSRTVRGRLLTLVLLALAMTATLVVVGPVQPLLFDPFGSGLRPRLLGILVGFNVLFFLMLAVLAAVYRWFASTRIRPVPLLLAAGAAASWLAGQTLGYVLAVRLVTGFAQAYGQYAPAAEVAAISFLVYLESVVVLLGYLLALQLHEAPRHPSAVADSISDDPGRHRDQRQPAARMGRPADQEQAPNA